jgi:hypothetical protein
LVIKVVDDGDIGPHVSTLDLGSRIYGHIEDATPASIPANQRSYIDILVQKLVLRSVAVANSQPGALNLVSNWNVSLISAIILMPTVVSIAINVAWPIVAVQTFGADVQISIQTAASLGSYVVTAGAILIGLVTLFDAIAK